MIGALLSLTSAFSFSVNAILVRRGIAGAGATPSQGAFITVLLGVPFGFVAVVLTGQLLRFGEISGSGYGLLLAAGVVHFGLGRYCNYRAIGAIGASRAGPIQAVTIPYSIGMAVVLLEETISLLMGIGILLILIGPAVMIERQSPSGPSVVATDSDRRKGSAPLVQEIELRQFEGYSFAIFAAIAYGTSPILIRAALEDATRTAAVGTFIAYVGAAVVLLISLILPGRRQLMGAINFRYMRLFGGAGLSVFLAQLLRFFALSMADVSIVNPLQRMASVFTLILSYLLNRSLEKINFKVVLGVLISFAGSALLVFAAATGN